jgi:hypothetical protein
VCLDALLLIIGALRLQPNAWKISFDKRGIIVNLSKILTDREKVRKKEITMFSVSEKASEMIKEFLKSRSEAASIRVLMQEGG